MKINNISSVHYLSSNATKVSKNDNTGYLYNPHFMSKDTTSFSGGSTYERQAEQMADTKRKNYNWFTWHMWGGKEKEIDNAKTELDKQILETEKKVARQEAMLEAAAKYEQELKSSILENKEAYDNVMKANKDALEAQGQTIIQQGKVVEAKNQLLAEREKMAEEFSKQRDELKNLLERSNLEKEKISKDMQDAIAKNDKKHEQELKKQLDMLKEMYDKQIDTLRSGMLQASSIEADLRKMSDLTIKSGFAKIAGYNAQKNILTNMVGAPVVLAKSGKPAQIPNGILFFGPKGTGKTTFVEALAGQLDCKMIPVSDQGDTEENIKELENALAEGMKNYKNNNGQHSIIRIDEFDGFTQDEDMVDYLKGLLDTIAKDYHCTIFATTNHPQKIDRILLRDGRFDVKVGLGPANKDDALSVLKFYGEQFADKDVNFDELIPKLFSSADNSVYSNARIQGLVNKYKKMHPEKTNMTQQDFIDSINEYGPDISKDELDQFQKDLEYMKKV